MGAPPVNVFVARAGNAFMRDIAVWLVEAASEGGRSAHLVDDRLPADDGSTNLVVAPHEFYVLRNDADRDVRRAARHSIPICTEQPGTPWFSMSLGFCMGSPFVVDINEVGARAIADLGFPAQRLLLGGVPSMDRTRASTRHDDRPIDVLFLGGATDRRNAALAQLAPVLWNRRSEIRLVSFSRPLTGAEPGVVVGDDKYDLLARAKVLVNLHRSDDVDGYFEWARMVETMANRCAIVTEPSLDHDPLIAGEHFVEATVDSLASNVIDLVDDHDRRRAITDAAHRAVMHELALATSVASLLDRIENEPPPPASTRRFALRTEWASRRPIVRTHRPPLLPVFEPHRARRREVYDMLLGEMHHRRELGRLRAAIAHGDDVDVDVVTTPGYGDATPDVSVIVTLYDYAGVVTETLDSIVASTDIGFEVIVVDDRSSDGGAEVVADYLRTHPDVPMKLVASRVNRGLPRSRNLAFEHTRADRVMVMDADNMVYPTCLRRLSDTLDAHPDAAFAYATLEAFGVSPGLRSERGWFVPWLCDSNYIDAQAMLRRSTWERHGGYRIDDDVYGWEDWDLWLRLAVAGERGVHVPEMLGRYRTQATSMISVTNLVAPDLRAGLVARYPTLPWPEHVTPGL